MNVVMDTNVLYQAIDNPNGASGFILNLIRTNSINLLISIPVFSEYEAVLKRETKSLNITNNDCGIILDFIAFIGIQTPIYYLWRPNLQDEKDNIFIELSINGNADYLITNNIKDYNKNNDLRFEGIQIEEPGNFVKKWRKYEN